MKFKQLIESYLFDDVWQTLIDLYPDQASSEKGYAKVYQELRELEPESSEMTIIVEYVIDEYDDSRYVDVSGFKDDYDTKWAIEFRPWAEWLGMEVITQFDDLETLAHCLFELTFFGYNKKVIKTHFDEIMERYEDVMSAGNIL